MRGTTQLIISLQTKFRHDESRPHSIAYNFRWTGAKTRLRSSIDFLACRVPGRILRFLMIAFPLSLKLKVLSMKEEQKYIRDIAEIRSMMERSTKFLSLSGLAGVMAGIYALIGAYFAYKVFNFNPDEVIEPDLTSLTQSSVLLKVIYLASIVLILAIGTAIFLSQRKAKQRGEKLWNSASQQMLFHMSVPLIVGGLLILILISKELIGLVAPMTLIFYGLALYNASKFTYQEVKSMGLIQIVLGLASSYFVGYGLLFWAIGFGVVHIIYGIYMHYRYER